jgi:methionyl-tRNA formyltransferase
MPKPRILFMGTPAFAVPALESLVRMGYPLIGVVTQPDRPQGRGRATTPPRVKLVAEGLDLTVLQPEKVRTSSRPSARSSPERSSAVRAKAASTSTRRSFRSIGGRRLSTGR